MVERTGKQDAGRITFVRNNAFHDAFFLKALGMSLPKSKWMISPRSGLMHQLAVLDGACQGDICVSAHGGKSYSVSVLDGDDRKTAAKSSGEIAIREQSTRGQRQVHHLGHCGQSSSCPK